MTEIPASLTNPFSNKTNTVLPVRICCVLDDFPGNPNIALAPFALPEKLARAGCRVTVLSFQSQHPNLITNNLCKHAIHYASVDYTGPAVSSLSPAVYSYQAMEWMLKNSSEFDVAFFPLRGGLAYYTLLAKHQGWAFQHHFFNIDCDTSTLWQKHLGHQWIDHMDDLATDFLERQSVSLADALVMEENGFRDWMNVHEWQIPQHVSIFSKEKCVGECLKAYEEKRSEQKRDRSVIGMTPPEVRRPLVSVCVTHFNRPHFLAQVLESIRAQDYPHFEVILIDDASTAPEAVAYVESLAEEFQSKGWKIIRNPHNLFPGAARNLAAHQSKGDYLLFMDDDNYAKPDQIRTFIQAAQHVDADILTCAMDVFCGPRAPSLETLPLHRFLPIGAAVGVGLYLNMFGDMNAMIKKEAYIALKGLTEERGIGVEDWEFFSRAVLQGFHLEVIPLALFWYRDTPNSITKTTHLYANSLRGIRAYLDAVPFALRNNLLMSQAQQEKLQQLLNDHQHLGKLLKRCWQLFFSRAWRALSDPGRTFKKIFRV